MQIIEDETGVPAVKAMVMDDVDLAEPGTATAGYRRARAGQVLPTASREVRAEMYTLVPFLQDFRA